MRGSRWGMHWAQCMHCIHTASIVDCTCCQLHYAQETILHARMDAEQMSGTSTPHVKLIKARDNHQNPISLDGILQHRCPVSHMGAAKDTARCTATVMHRTSTCSRVKVPRHVLHACVRYSRQCRNVPAKSGAKRYHLLHSLLKALNAAMLKLSIIQGVVHALPEPSLRRDSCLMMSRQHCHGSAMGTGKTLTGCRAS